MQRRPKISRPTWISFAPRSPTRSAISVQSGFPTPRSDVVLAQQDARLVQVYGVTPEYQTIQDYKFLYGEPLTRWTTANDGYVGVVGADITDKLFDGRRSRRQVDPRPRHTDSRSSARSPRRGKCSASRSTVS